MIKTIFLSLVAIAIIPFSTGAAEPGGHAAHMAGGKGIPVVTQEYMKAMDAMHGGMMRGIQDPDPDAAFVKGMLPHHQGAVDMARIQLKYGKDPEMRKLAEGIIAAQEKEIAQIIAVRLRGNKKVQNFNSVWYEDVAQTHTTQGDFGLELP